MYVLGDSQNYIDLQVFIFIKYSVELFLLIDSIICMGKVDSLVLPEKITCYWKYIIKLGTVINISNILWSHNFLPYGSVSRMKRDLQTDLR